MTRILLLEDDNALIDGLEYSLKKNGFLVKTARTVEEALTLLVFPIPFDLLILDVTLPDQTGFFVCEKVRAEDSRIPILFLTASDEEVNVIRGLDCGGDDYVTKPFKIGELCSRIHALLRRTKNTAALTFGSLSIDTEANLVTIDGKTVELTRAEYRLLCLLAKNAGMVVTRERILDELWDQAGDFVDDNTLSVYVRRLREKIESDPAHPDYLVTIRGFGYKWNAQKGDNR